MPNARNPPRRGSKSEAMRSHDSPTMRPTPISNASVAASHRKPRVHQRLAGCGRSHPSVNQKTAAISSAPVTTLT